MNLQLMWKSFKIKQFDFFVNRLVRPFDLDLDSTSDVAVKQAKF